MCWCGYRAAYAGPRRDRRSLSPPGGTRRGRAPSAVPARRVHFAPEGAFTRPPLRPARRVVRAAGPALPTRGNSHVSSPAEGRPGRGGAAPPGAPVSSTCGAPAPPIPEQVGESCAFDWSERRVEGRGRERPDSDWPGGRVDKHRSHPPSLAAGRANQREASGGAAWRRPNGLPPRREGGWAAVWRGRVARGVPVRGGRAGRGGAPGGAGRAAAGAHSVAAAAAAGLAAFMS